jgi:hypothetical protein
VDKLAPAKAGVTRSAREIETYGGKEYRGKFISRAKLKKPGVFVPFGSTLLTILSEVEGVAKRHCQSSCKVGIRRVDYRRNQFIWRYYL